MIARPDPLFGGVILKDILPRGMTFVAASEEGMEEEGVVTWYLGDIPPGASGSRSVVVQVASSTTGGTLLTNHKAKLEDNEGRGGVWINKITSVRPVSIGDDDDDGFPNEDEVTCGSDPLDPASTCYSVDLSESIRTVRRGSEVSFTAALKKHFNFEGPVTFNTPNTVSGTIWSFSNPSALLSGSQSSASVSFTIQTTSSTPLGLHEIPMRATSGSMRSSTAFILEVVP